MKEPILFGIDFYEDNRGRFYESFTNRHLEKQGIFCNFVQDNQSIWI